MEELVSKWEDGDLKLYPHQHIGVKTMLNWLSNGHGGIVADEMGLGKTCQTSVVLTHLSFQGHGPFLIICPLAVCDHWEAELEKFSGNRLQAVNFAGYRKDERMRQEGEIVLTKTSVIIIARHFVHDTTTFRVLTNLQNNSGLRFTHVVIDEAQFVKNLESQTSIYARKISQAGTKTKYLLLTGTPIQNNLNELYSLLCFADQTNFLPQNIDVFVQEHYKNNFEEVKNILKKYMIRRTKEDVFTDNLKECEQVLLYHGINDLQKQIYKDIISKNHFSLKSGNKNAVLMNILMQLRKCAIHPYLFRGVEPEPFTEGEHIVEASVKLQVVDRLLKYMTERGHKCLIFSQFLGMLDIMEDFLRIRKIKYERIDGHCIADERSKSIKSFQSKKGGPVCFLLSTRAGGLGLNLVAADTVIFLDSDWNPQVDIQAMARCHRIGQNKPVRVIRLVARYTVEQYLVAKARDKLKLADEVVGSKDVNFQAADLVDMLKNTYGKLMNASSQAFACNDEELEKLVGKSIKGHWQPVDKAVTTFLNAEECDVKDVDVKDYTIFEGKTYREEWDKLMNTANIESESRPIRRRTSYAFLPSDGNNPSKKKKNSLPSSNTGKRISTNLPVPAAGDQEDSYEDQENTSLKHVFGDVTRLEKYSTGKDLILLPVDDGKVFGTGELFSAIRSLSPEVVEIYEKTGKMGDHHLGDAHLYMIDRPISSSSCSNALGVVYLVTQSSKERHKINPEILEKCLSRVSEFAKENGFSIHTPRIEKNTDITSYMVDRLCKKYFSFRGIPCFIYYYSRTKSLREEGMKENNEDDKENYYKINKHKKQNNMEENVKTTISARGRIRKIVERPTIKLDDDDDEDDDSDDLSSATESESEQSDWVDESESDEQEESGEEELEDVSVSEPEDSPVKKASRFQQKNSICAKASSSSNRQFGTKCFSTLIRDELPFRNEKVSIFKIDEDEQDFIRKRIQKHGGEVIMKEEDLDKATFVVIPTEMLEKESQLEEFKSHFSKDCHFVRQEFISYAIEDGSLDDLALFVV